MAEDDARPEPFGRRAPAPAPPAAVPVPDRAATKRSQTVSTVLVAGAGLAALGLGSFDRNAYQDVLVYPDAAACAAEAIRPAEECRGEYAIARAAYPRGAPHYDGLAACESHHGGGHCLTDPAGAARVFVPRMAGYLIGRTAAQGVTPEPVYEHRTGGVGHGGGYCTGSGGRVSGGSGGSSAARVTSSAVHASASTGHATSFGGFGGTGHGFSGHGGS